MAQNPDLPFFRLSKHPATASRQFNSLTRNIVVAHRTFKAENPTEYKEGLVWYPKAHDIASRIADGDITRGAGIIAALSPQKRWDQNVAIARDMFRTGSAGHTTVQVGKARRILEGEHPLDVLKGDKERSFFMNIHDPNDPNPVTIDRHAHDIAVNKIYGESDRGLDAAGRYDTFAKAYRVATGELGLDVANRTQSAPWHGRAMGII